LILEIPLCFRDTFGSVESVKAASDVYSPVKGSVLEVNEALEESPSLVNESPEENGWFMKLKVCYKLLFSAL